MKLFYSPFHTFVHKVLVTTHECGHWDHLDRVATFPFKNNAGEDYSIADMATYPWCAPIIRKLHAIDIDSFPHVKRWASDIEARPAVQRGMAVLADVMKIGDPDPKAREALFGKR